MKLKTDDKGFTCECGERHDYVSWLFAHWDEQVFVVCKKCGREHWVRRGRVWLKRKRKHNVKEAV